MGVSGSTDTARRGPLQRVSEVAPNGWWRDAWVGYVAALVTTSAALGLTWLAQAELHRVIFVLFFLAVILTAWIGGRGPALLAIVLALLAVDYFFIAPVRRFAVGGRDDVASLVSFALLSAVVSWLIASQRRISREMSGQARHLHEQNDALESQVEESQALQEDLERTSEALAAANRALGQDITERRRALEAQVLLSEASETLAASLDYEQTLTTLANLVVRGYADWCSIAIGDETGRYSNLAVAHRDPERVQWAEEYNRMNPPRFDTPTGVPNVLRTGQSEFYPEITRELLLASVQSTEEMRVIDELQMRSAMVVPMVARGRTIGAISLIGTESRPPFTPGDLRLAEQLARHAAIAIDNARLFDESRIARADAEAANQAKGQFLAAMSHELRTPLNAIAGYAELIGLEVLGPVTEKQRDAIDRLQRSGRHLAGLVDQVLSFARIEAGKIAIDLAPVPVNSAMSALAEMIAPQAAAKSLSYQFDGCAADVAVLADRDRLDQIALNLLANAVKFTPAGGAVRVTVECDLISVSIRITDTGPGIPPEKQDSIFQPFVQLASHSAGASGVGLGLAISRDLARAMGGDISVSSTVGAGAAFTLRLPRYLDASPSAHGATEG